MTNKAHQGSAIGAALLVTGTCIGGGMLGIPLITGLAGFIPGLLVNAVCWLFMLCTGLLFLEVTLWMPRDTNVISMTKRFLGSVGKTIGGASFVFLYYCLLIAYISGAVPLFSEALTSATGIELNNAMSYIIFPLIFGLIIFLGATTIDRVNTILMTGLVISYFLLVGQNASTVKMGNLVHQNWKYFFLAMPILFSAYGYHNIIPSISSYLKQNVKLLRWSVIIGVSIPFIIYSVWQLIIIGTVPESAIQEAFDKGLPITSLVDTTKHAWWKSTVAFFSFFALTTSLLGVAFSTLDFLSDGLKIQKTGIRRLILCAVVFVPPTVWAAYKPGVFVSALGYAGGFGESILNGLIPILMVWRGHYHMKLPLKIAIPGGRITLSVLAAVTLLIIVIETLEVTGVFHIM